VYEILLTAGIFNFLSKNLALDISSPLHKIRMAGAARRNICKKGKSLPNIKVQRTDTGIYE
jgi:hypothetical protein